MMSSDNRADDDDTTGPDALLDSDGGEGTVTTPGVEHKHDGTAISQHQMHVSTRDGRRRWKADGRGRVGHRLRGRRSQQYQYVEQMVMRRERAVHDLRRQLELVKRYCMELDEGRIPAALRLLVSADSTSE